ncbi:MAG: ATP-binding protein [Eubacteriales bacterium]|nr:ATP-binding protein [Eubacteriales bacterium]
MVNVDNIQMTRYSRNPRIARVLTEFGWVRELNEGVKRIFEDMESFYLDPPIYSEPEQTVKLVLKNNIEARNLRQKDRAREVAGVTDWKELDNLEKQILTYMSGKVSVTNTELCEVTKKSNATVSKRLNHLIDLNIICINGNKYDPLHTYSLQGATR